MWNGAKIVGHGAQNVWHGAESVRRSAKNVRLGAKNVRICAENVQHDVKKAQHIFFHLYGLRLQTEKKLFHQTEWLSLFVLIEVRRSIFD